MGIGLVVLAALASTFITQSKVYNVQEQVNEMQQNARGALDVMAREIKMAGYKPNGGTVVGVTYNAAQLKIQADLDASGGIDTNTEEQITYSYDSTNHLIRRTIGATSQTLAEDIANFTFEYLDANGAITTTTANIRQVRLNLTARTAKADPTYPSNSGYRTYEVTAVITPPNLAL